jgi:hypothetical protein
MFLEPSERSDSWTQAAPSKKAQALRSRAHDALRHAKRDFRPPLSGVRR